jgi:hypothetical protein
MKLRGPARDAPPDVAIGKRGDQGRLVNDSPARNVHHDGTGPKKSQATLIERPWVSGVSG